MKNKVERPLKIAMLSTHSCPLGKLGGKDTGGMSVWVREVAGEWGRQGHTVDVFTRIKDLKDTHTVDINDKARLIHLPAGSIGEISKLSLFEYLPEFAENVESYRRENGLEYDIIMSHYWLSGQAGRILQLKWDVPHIVMFHTIGAIKNTLIVGEQEPALRLETEKTLTHGCCYVISATAQEKRALVKHYAAKPENVFVIPCGVNMDMFRPVNKTTARQHIGFTGDKLVVFVGRIEPLKGIDELIKAIPLLPRGEDVRLVIVGGDEYSRPEITRLQGIAHSLGIGNLVSFPGLIKQEQLAYFYSAADVCVSPSYYESFGLTVLESLSCGTPVVATDVGAARIVIRNEASGLVIPDNSPRVLADSIARVLSRQPLSSKQVQQIRESVSGFKWEDTARASLKICRKAVSRYSTPVPS